VIAVVRDIILQYRIKDTGKTADDVRKAVIDITKAECYVEVHPGLLRIRFAADIKAEQIKAVDEYVKTEFDGVRIG